MTAVEWLEDKLNGVDTGVSYHHFKKIIEQAKEMEKEQIIDAFEHFAFNLNDGEQYYNETFKNTNK